MMQDQITEEEMKTDNESRACIFLCILVITALLIAFIAKNNVHAATTRIPEEVLVDHRQIEWYEETLRAYNHLLHRVWIDRPNYVLDVLTETDEFVTLDSLMNGHWEDTFEFYNKQDSVEYHDNWMNEDVELPKEIKIRLADVFNQ